MRVGLVCPYAWDVPGGVQYHVRDLAQRLQGWGHEVSVIAPGEEDAELPEWVVPAGRAVPVPYNGSVARLSFGLLSAARVRRWLREGRFDVLHVHEPASPSLSLLACWSASGPIVATFHTSNPRSRAMTAAYPMLQPALEKISARIAVSEAARRTLVEHLGGDAVLIPNGVEVDRFSDAEPDARFTGRTLGFIGRIDEPRKGLPTLLEAFTLMRRRDPEVRLVVAGRGDVAEARRGIDADVREAVVFLGEVSEEEKAALLSSVDVYVAPNLGGESFGIILVEAMAAGAPVLASDLEAFRRVLDGGELGALFPTGDAAALAAAAADLLADPARRAGLSERARRAVRRYDWSTVAADIVTVYETVAAGGQGVTEDERVSRRRGGYRGTTFGLGAWSR